MLTFILCFVSAVWGFIALRAVRAYRLRREYERAVVDARVMAIRHGWGA
jgi:hypothetical protein